MIKSTGAAHKCRSAGFRLSARIMCYRTSRLYADVGNEPQTTPRLWCDEVPLKCCLKCFAEFWKIGVSFPGWNIIIETCMVTSGFLHCS